MIDPGNRMSQALDVGSLVGRVSFSDSVNKTTDADDFYRVTLDRSSRLNASLIKTGSPATFDLIRDVNNNDIVDNNELIGGRASTFGGNDASADYELPAGTYFIALKTDNFNQSAYDYTLTLTNTPVGTLTIDPGNLMSQALDIGILNGSRTFSEYAGNSLIDGNDFYRFTLDRPTDVSLTLTLPGLGLSQWMDLIQDLNKNDVVESNERIAGRSAGTSTPHSINQTLQPGTYFVEIHNRGIGSGSNYTLNFFTPGAAPFPFGADGPFFNLSTDADTIVLNAAQVGNLVVRALDGDDVVQGSANNDIVVGNIGNDRIVGNLGDDFLLGGRDNDRVEGGDGNDFVSGNLGNDVVYGNAGNDIVRGGQDNDSLFGGDGDDQLSGDFGTDILTGEAGNDLFILRSSTAAPSVAAADIIADFTAGQDAIALTNGLGFAGIALDASGSNTAIRVVATGQILGVVAGVQPAALSAGNFTTLPGDF
jgi:Ca2+-binding RTX toxin-like protein